MHNPFTLEGKRIIITGASSGIGRQTAISCSQMGAQLLLIGRNEERLEETRNNLHNSEHHHLQSLDLSLTDTIKDELKGKLLDFGKIDGLVHSAGVSPTVPLRVIKQQTIRDTFAVNVDAAINLVQMVTKSKYRPDSGQSLVLISSVMATVGESGKSVYGMTKASLVAAANSLSVELAGQNVRINCISPGVVDTPMSQGSVYASDQEALIRIRSYHPLGLGAPEDIAHASVYLLSDASRWVTGTNMIVDGGYTAK